MVPGPGIVLDFRDKPDGAEITADDLRLALARLSHVIVGGEIVLLMTGADKYWGTAEYSERGPGLGREGVFWLVDQGVHIIGIDAWGLDRAFSVMRQEYRGTKNPNCIWGAHFAGRSREYCQLEKLTNLHLLPPKGFTLSCFPVKVARGGAGWSRVVAILDGAVAGSWQ
jgi:kynurenine formamidase